jgi:hypothetical protein
VDPSGRTVKGVGLQPLACWYCGFKYLWEHGCLSLVNVVCCQIEVCGMSPSDVQRDPTEYVCVTECDQTQQ